MFRLLLRTNINKNCDASSQSLPHNTPPFMREKRFIGYVRRHHRLIMKVCLMVSAGTNLDAEDIYQEVVAYLWSHRERLWLAFRHEAAEETYIYRVALNVALKYRTSMERAWRTERMPPAATDIPLSHEDTERLEELQYLLGCLDDDDRQIVRLRLEGYSHAEIARRLHLSEGAVATRYSRIVARLRKISQRDLGEARRLDDDSNHY